MNKNGWAVILLVGLGIWLLSRKKTTKDDDGSQPTDAVEVYKHQMDAATTPDMLAQIETVFRADYYAGKLTLDQYNLLAAYYSQRQNQLVTVPPGMPTLEHLKDCYGKLVADRPDCHDVDYDQNGIITIVDFSRWSSSRRNT